MLISKAYPCPFNIRITHRANVLAKPNKPQKKPSSFVTWDLLAKTLDSHQTISRMSPIVPMVITLNQSAADRKVLFGSCTVIFVSLVIVNLTDKVLMS